MALDSGAPIIPIVIGGAQRIWTKGHPKALGRHNFKIAIGVCEPIVPDGTAEEITRRLHDSMSAKLDELQEFYAEWNGPYPAGEFWVPAKFGGGAPTLEEANAMDVAEQEEKRRKRDVE